MQKLNLPEYSLRLKTTGGQAHVFDVIRKKWIVLTPEEWVRQNFIQHLYKSLDFPLSLMRVETGFRVGTRGQRSDVLLHNRQGQVIGIVECKAPDVSINQKVFDQIVRYNMQYRVNYLIVTNGLSHYCCRVNYQNQSYAFLASIPDFATMSSEETR